MGATETAKNEMVQVQTAVSQLSVQDQSTFEEGTLLLKSINGAIKKVEALLDPPCRTAFANYKETMAHKNSFLDPIKAAKAEVTKKLSHYATELENRRKEEEKKAREEAEKREEEERKRLEEEADKAAEVGDMEKAQDLQMQADTHFEPPAVTDSQDLGKVAGVAKRAEYEVDVVDLKAFLAEIISGRVRINLEAMLTVKPGAIKNYLKATNHTDIPGLKVRKVMKIVGTGA